MSLFTLDELESAAKTVRAFVPPTPAYAWPLLAAATGAEFIVEVLGHTGAFSFDGVVLVHQVTLLSLFLELCRPLFHLPP